MLIVIHFNLSRSFFYTHRGSELNEGGSDLNDSYGRRFLSLYSWWSILCLVGMQKYSELNYTVDSVEGNVYDSRAELDAKI